MTVLIAGFVLPMAASAGSAQFRLPHIARGAPVATQQQQQGPVALTGIDALRADFLAKSGSNVIPFTSESVGLGAPARQILVAQAMWLRQHPEVVVRIEGHGEPNDTRDHALAMGARRAQEVRDYLVLLGVPAAQLSTTSLGKERPGPPRAITMLVR